MNQINFETHSIRRRLMLSFMLTTGLALILASSAYLYTQFDRAKSGMVREIGILARVLGENTAAPLVFDDVTSAEMTLAALQAHRHVMAAVLYDDEKDPFAAYLRDDVKELPAPSRYEDGHAFVGGTMELFEPIIVEEERAGTIFILTDTAELSQLMWNFLIIFMFVTLGSLVICYIGASMLRNQIAIPLGALVEGSGKLSQGDLSVQVEVDVEGELAVLAAAFNGMANSLRGIVAQVGRNTAAVSEISENLRQSSDAIATEGERQQVAVGNTAESIERIHASIREVSESIETLSHTAIETATAATQMDASSTEIAAHMDSLAESIQDSASAVVEMTGAIREIARNAEELDGLTESTASDLSVISSMVKQVEENAQQTHAISLETVEHANRGMLSVEQTVEGMKEIRSSFHSVQEIIDDLSHKSESIGEVIKVIEEVVEQTNLLALNAAIISSQAGEHGRAFAVVADEVRNLAERTSGSTKEITQLVADVQTSVGTAVKAVRRSNEHVENGVSLSREAGDILRLIGEGAKTSSERVHEIVQATEQQGRDIDRVDGAMGQVKTIAAQLSHGTHEQDNASAGITRAVERMGELGQQVKHSTDEQRKESRLISQALEVVSTRTKEIFAATRNQGEQGDQILEALQVFREVNARSNQRNGEMREFLDALAERSGILEDEVGRFRT